MSPYFIPTTPVNTTNLTIISSILCFHILIPSQSDTNNTTQINTPSPIYTLLYSFLLNAYNQYTYFMHPHVHPHMHLQYLRLHTLPLFIYESICIRINDYMHPHFFTRESKSSGCLWESYIYTCTPAIVGEKSFWNVVVVRDSGNYLCHFWHFDVVFVNCSFCGCS